MSTIQPDLFEFEHERGIMSQLLRRSRLYRTSADFKALLEFVIRMRNIAPFNAMLLQIQKPGLRFAASEEDWWVRCKRTVKQGARPLIIMWPFGPFALVYDLVDTEGRELLPDDVASAFRATGDVTARDISRYMRHPVWGTQLLL